MLSAIRQLLTTERLSSAFADGYRLNLLTHNPMEKVKKLTKRATPTKHIPQADAERIYAYATKDPYTHARIDLGMYMGLHGYSLYSCLGPACR